MRSPSKFPRARSRGGGGGGGGGGGEGGEGREKSIVYSFSLVAKEQILLHEYCQKQNPWPLKAARKGMTVSM